MTDVIAALTNLNDSTPADAGIDESLMPSHVLKAIFDE